MKEAGNWALRYLVLLWLSLICLLPFDLSQFDEIDGDDPASALEKIALNEISKPGIEREGAALVLARLYMRWVLLIIVLVNNHVCSDSRKDSITRFHPFVRLCEAKLPSADIFLVRSFL